MNVLNNLQASLRCGIARGKIERKDNRFTIGLRCEKTEQKMAGFEC